MAAVAVATMRGKSYLQIGSVTMGIGGSIMDQNFMEEYLGLRVESVDEVEILRRMEEGIYDHEAYEKALAWTKEHCKEGRDDNPEYVDFLGEKRRIKFTKEEKEKLRVSNNLTELDAKSAKELVAEGKKVSRQILTALFPSLQCSREQQ